MLQATAQTYDNLWKQADIIPLEIWIYGLEPFLIDYSSPLFLYLISFCSLLILFKRFLPLKQETESPPPLPGTHPRSLFPYLYVYTAYISIYANL